VEINAKELRQRFEKMRAQLLSEEGLHIWAPPVIDGDSLFKSLHMAMEGEGEDWPTLRKGTIAYMSEDEPCRHSVVWHARAAGAHELRDKYDGHEVRLANESGYLDVYFR
jgi:hypothetical protein